MHWARMFSSGSPSPVCLSTPVSIRPSRSVVSRRISLGAPLGDEPVHQVVHERLVLVQLPLRADLQSGLDRQLAHSGLRLASSTRTIASTKGCGVSR